jgi:3-methyladenine DNA glycosylase AlkD
MDSKEVLKKLESMGDPKNVEGMARFGIFSAKVYGVPKPELRTLAKEIGKNHKLALKLWDSGVLDARDLASMIDDPTQVTEKQMESWVADFDNWDVCDQTTGNLFDRTPFAYKKCREWSGRREEFVKRAAFSMIAWLAVHDKKADNKRFEQFFPIIKRESTDERNFVRKAVNWALRNIGKRNITLNKRAIEVAEEIEKLDSKSARWIAKDALRELKGEKIQKRFKKK